MVGGLVLLVLLLLLQRLLLPRLLLLLVLLLLVLLLVLLHVLLLVLLVVLLLPLPPPPLLSLLLSGLSFFAFFPTSGTRACGWMSARSRAVPPRPNLPVPQRPRHCSQSAAKFSTACVGSMC